MTTFMQLSSPIQYLPKVGPVMAGKLKKLNIETIENLLWHAPARFEDYSKIVKIGTLHENEPVTVIGEIISSKNVYTRSRKTIQRLKIGDESGQIEILWFNQPFLIKNFELGKKIAISGIAQLTEFTLKFISPEYEIVYPNRPLFHTGRLVPVYPETAGVSSKWLRLRIAQVLTNLDITEYLPTFILDKYKLPDIKTAFIHLHQPSNLQSVEISHKRLAFEELLLLNLQSINRRTSWQQKTLTKPFVIDKNKIGEFIKKLPFQLTSSQQKVTDEILTDLQKTTAMNRLLEGDVGSGKTVVAAIAIYATHLNGFNSVIMAPTEILAEQHFKTLKMLLEPFKLKIGLLTSSHKEETTMKQFNNKTINILIGTHAIIQRSVTLTNVKLIIIDEQHRFGVEQRALLKQKGDSPHILTMTATPIPRTMALTVYGDLDLSVIDEMPKGRKNIKTWVVPQVKRSSAYTWIEKNIRELSIQAFIICPFIDPSESFTSVKAAKEEFINLQKNVFPKLKLALLHGNLKSREKNEILSGFANKKYDILVATPVVEVGIDIPNASIMVIEAAERYGLAQLHQLRGRVGRSDQQSYCLLFTSPESQQVIRLKYLEKPLNGPELSEIDLKLRGPGDIYGKFQHGYNALKIASLTDLPNIQIAKTEAEKLLLHDPDLNNFPVLKDKLNLGKISNIVAN